MCVYVCACVRAHPYLDGCCKYRRDFYQAQSTNWVALSKLKTRLLDSPSPTLIRHLRPGLSNERTRDNCGHTVNAYLPFLLSICIWSTILSSERLDFLFLGKPHLGDADAMLKFVVVLMSLMVVMVTSKVISLFFKSQKYHFPLFCFFVCFFFFLLCHSLKTFGKRVE